MICDVCLTTTHVAGENLEYATLEAHWGYGSQHDGERYEIHLCESCFFSALAYFKQERRVQNLFSEDGYGNRVWNKDDPLGLLARDEYFQR